MNSFYRQLGARSLVALATLGLVMPTLGSSPCVCASKPTAVEESLPPCCAQRAKSTCCDDPAVASRTCCSEGSQGDTPCNCPGCNCSVQSSDAVTVGAVIAPTDSNDQFASLAVAAEWLAVAAEPFSRAALAEQSLLRTPPLPLRALYCVWVI